MVEKAAKVSISLPSELASEVRAYVGQRGLSAFAARALRHELQRERLGEFLEELAQIIGPPDEKLVAQIDELWPDG
ncbi:MAG: hypothetical protein ACRDZ4_05240 [Egibacteraceae bacterium]